MAEVGQAALEPRPADAGPRRSVVRPRVALVAHGIHDDGGMERAFAELIRHLHDRYDFVVLSSDLGEDLRGLVEWHRVPVPRRPVPLRFALFYVLAGLRLAAVRADVVHTLGAIVPNRADVASVHFCDAGFVESVGRLAPPNAPLVRRANTALARLLGLLAERWSYRPTRVRWLAPVSEGLAREVARLYPGVEQRIAVNGIDGTRFRPDPPARAAVREELGIGDGEVVALFVGGDWHGKGLRLALEALARAPSTSGLRLVVVGRGDVRGFSRLAARLGIDGRVVFAGQRRDAERFYAAADLFLLPSNYETFSLAAFEAASSELPVVAPRVHGIDELLEHGTAGILVERDPDAIAAAVGTLAAAPELRRRLGAAARERARAFTWQRSAEAIDGLYRAVLADGAVAVEGLAA